MRGWLKDIRGMQMELWADETGMPLTMTIHQAAGVSLDFDFAFDVPLDVRLFSMEVPAGYTLKQGDDE
jgi:hypothetical protein